MTQLARDDLARRASPSRCRAARSPSSRAAGTSVTSAMALANSPRSTPNLPRTMSANCSRSPFARRQCGRQVLGARAAQRRPGSGRRACTPPLPRPALPWPPAARGSDGCAPPVDPLSSGTVPWCPSPASAGATAHRQNDEKLGSDDVFVTVRPAASGAVGAREAATVAHLDLADELIGVELDQCPLDLFEPLELHGLADVHRVGELRLDLRHAQRGRVELLVLRGDEAVDLDPHEHRLTDGARQLLLDRVDRLLVDLGDIARPIRPCGRRPRGACASRSTSRFDSAPIASSKPAPTRPIVASRLAILTPLCSLIRSSIAIARSTIFMSMAVDALRQDLPVLGQLPGDVGAGLVDEPRTSPRRCSIASASRRGRRRPCAGSSAATVSLM